MGVLSEIFFFLSPGGGVQKVGGHECIGNLKKRENAWFCTISWPGTADTFQDFLECTKPLVYKLISHRVSVHFRDFADPREFLLTFLDIFLISWKMKATNLAILNFPRNF